MQNAIRVTCVSKAKRGLVTADSGRGSVEIPATVDYDAFGRIYEYFLSEFARTEGQKGGEFYTPSCNVRLLTEVIEPYHGRILDPACGSGGMFVQSARFVGRRYGVDGRFDATGRPAEVYVGPPTIQGIAFELQVVARLLFPASWAWQQG